MGEQTFSPDDRVMYCVNIQRRFAALHVNPLPAHRQSHSVCSNPFGFGELLDKTRLKLELLIAVMNLLTSLKYGLRYPQ